MAAGKSTGGGADSDDGDPATPRSRRRAATGKAAQTTSKDASTVKAAAPKTAAPKKAAPRKAAAKPTAESAPTRTRRTRTKAPEGDSSAARSRPRSATRASRQTAPEQPAEITEFVPNFGPEVYSYEDPDDERRGTRSSYIRNGTFEKWRDVVAFCKSLEYENPALEGKLPTNMGEFMDFALCDLAAKIEQVFNDGKPVRRVYKLPKGPSRTGAQRGAALRARAREEQARGE